MQKDANNLLLAVILSLVQFPGAPWFQARQLSHMRLSPHPPGLMGSCKFTSVVGKALSTSDFNKNFGDGFAAHQLLALCGRYEVGINDHRLFNLSESNAWTLVQMSRLHSQQLFPKPVSAEQFRNKC